MADDQSLLSEHEPHPDTSGGKSAGYQPTDEEKKSIRLVQGLFDKAKKHRKSYDSKWLDYYKMFRGKQWKEKRPSYRHSEVINMIFSALQSQVAMLTDSRPRVEFVPKDPSDMELASLLNEMFESDWESGNWLMTLTESIYDAKLYGNGFGHMGYDPKADLGAGAIKYESADPFYCFPSPSAWDVNKRNKYFIYAEPVDIESLKQEHPDKARFIKPDLVDLVGGSKTELEQIRFRSPVDARSMVEGGEGSDAFMRDQALKITCYLDSDEVSEEHKEETDPQTGAVSEVFEQRKKYPEGRRIVIAGGVLLEDGPNPFEDRKFPYAKLTNYILPREFWGISEIEPLESPQKIFNKLVSFALDVLTLMGNPIWVVDNDSGIDTDNLYNSPGLVVEKNKGTEAKRVEGVQLQPYVLQLIDRMQAWFEGISGRTDVTQGQNPSGVTAAAAISELQEAAQTRIRLQSRFLDAHLVDLGTLWQSRAFQFYTAGRVFRVTRNENAHQYFKTSIEPAPEGMDGKIVRVQRFNVDPATGQGGWGAFQEIQTQGQFDVRVTTGSSLPFAKAQKVQMATLLFDRGAIDSLELLKAADYPNYEAVHARVEQAKAAQAEMAMQAQAAGAPPAPAAPPA